jgi:hypothetical protein
MTPSDELHDRLIDYALHEVVGGLVPPDLTTRILAAAETPVTRKEDTTMERPKRSQRVWVALAAAACLLVGAGYLLVAMQEPRLARSVIANERGTRSTVNNPPIGPNLRW